MCLLWADSVCHLSPNLSSHFILPNVHSERKGGFRALESPRSFPRKEAKSIPFYSISCQLGDISPWGLISMVYTNLGPGRALGSQFWALCDIHSRVQPLVKQQWQVDRVAFPQSRVDYPTGSLNIMRFSSEVILNNFKTEVESNLCIFQVKLLDCIISIHMHIKWHWFDFPLELKDNIETCPINEVFLAPCLWAFTFNLVPIYLQW